MLTDAKTANGDSVSRKMPRLRIMGRCIFLVTVTVGACAGDVGAEETLSWARCVNLAAQHNPTLVASRAQVEAAEAGVGVTRSALLPQLSAGASAGRSRGGEQVVRKRFAIATAKESGSSPLMPGPPSRKK